MDKINELQQELAKYILERNEVHKIPRVLRLHEDKILLKKISRNILRTRARIKSIENKEIYYKPENIKKRKISNWKKSGICSRNWDKLYDVYTNTNKCNHCKIIIVNYNLKMTLDTKVLHHNHDTDKPIAIVCNLCNIKEGCNKILIKQNENIC